MSAREGFRYTLTIYFGGGAANITLFYKDTPRDVHRYQSHVDRITAFMLPETPDTAGVLLGTQDGEARLKHIVGYITTDAGE